MLFRNHAPSSQAHSCSCMRGRLSRRLDLRRCSRSFSRTSAHDWHNAAGQRIFKSEPVGAANVISTNTVQLGAIYVYANSESGMPSLPSWAILSERSNGGASLSRNADYIWLPLEDVSGSSTSAIPIAMYTGGRYFNIHSDHLGTPRLITDDTAAPVWQWPYSAFGETKPTGLVQITGSGTTQTIKASTATFEFNLRFPGQHADGETGQFYNYFRTYQPNQGRYTQNDPIGLDGGWNRFAYVEGDPLSLTDPEGLQTTRPRVVPTQPLYPSIGSSRPTSPVGSTRSPIEVRPGTNSSGEVGGRSFSGHSFDRTQGRGIPPSVVLDTILVGRPSPGSRPNTTQYYNPTNNVTVVVNSSTGNVITVRNGPPSSTCP
jgi:RHS repeat-associated protein